MSQKNKTRWYRSGAFKVVSLLTGLFVIALIIGSLKSGTLILFILLEAFLLWGLFTGLKSGEFMIGNEGLVKSVRKKKNPFSFWFTAVLTLGFMIFLAFKVYVNWEYVFIN